MRTLLHRLSVNLRILGMAAMQLAGLLLVLALSAGSQAEGASLPVIIAAMLAPLQCAAVLSVESTP